jgi:site-specific DNA-methyltransferase (adenine-specific)
VNRGVDARIHDEMTAMNQEQLRIYNEDCITGARLHLSDDSIDLTICDPPFGIGEGVFGSQYNRLASNVLPGYVEAPGDYGSFTLAWMAEAKRTLKESGSMYVVSGHSNLVHVLRAIQRLGLFAINHVIWKYNFGVYTRRKFVTSHYHILYLKKHAEAVVTFNRNCRFADDALSDNGDGLLDRDLEDVWTINREYQRGQLKNSNKLPEGLVQKMIQYSSNPGDTVCDFFLGNFTTATVARKLGRVPMGFELNRAAFEYHSPRLSLLPFGGDLATERTRIDGQGSQASTATSPHCSSKVDPQDATGL